MKKIICLCLALAMLLCACATEKPVTKTSRSFIDDLGRSVQIPDKITRIMPSAAMSQLILTAIAPDLMVGLATEADDPLLPESIRSLKNFGKLHEVNAEELALAQPQVIIDIGEPKDSVREELENLEQKTLIPTIYLSATLETMPETFRKLGALLDREEKAEELAQFCEKTYARTERILQSAEKVDCLYVVGAEGLNVIAQSSYHAQLVDLLTHNLAVVDNPLSKGSGNAVTPEQIALWNPEFVLFESDSIYDTARDNPCWQHITAIRNNHFVEVPKRPYPWLSMPPSVQRYLGMLWLTYVLYPELCDYDLQAEVTEYFRLFYGCELTGAQYEDLLKNSMLK